MSSPDFYLCDICGAHVAKELRFFVVTGSQMDAAGSSEDTGGHLDLCNVCAVAATEFLLRCPMQDKDSKGSALLSWARQQWSRRNVRK